MKIGFFALVLAGIVSAGGLVIGGSAKASELTVEVSGLRNYQGHVVLELWPESADSPKFPETARVQFRDERMGDPPCDFPNASVCRRQIESLQNLTVQYTFKSLPAGDYAVFVFHDENNNGILDTGLLNRPLEARGYSGVLPGDISPVGNRIRFEQARFALAGSKTITVGLRYPPHF
jgi:uncharacterized protein (DUF2141 family)